MSRNKLQSAHQELIEMLVEQDSRIKTKGFMEALRKVCPYLDGLYAEDPPRASRPDAYFIDEKRQIVFILEVEVTHPLDEDALERYWDLFWILDEDHWDLRLVTIDRRGVASLIDTMILAFHPDGRHPGNLIPAEGGVFSVLAGTWSAWPAKHLADFDAGMHWSTDDITADREDEDGDRRSLRHLLVARPGPLLDAACDEIEGLRAEVARLRAQGEALADCRTARPDGPGCGACCACLGHAVSVAAAAEKAAYLRGRSEAIDDEAGFIRTAIYSIMRRPRSAEEDPTQKPRAAEAEHVADAVARLWREHVAARAAQGQGQGQGPAGPCAHVVRVVDTHPMAPGPGWDLVACERCKAVGHRARAWGGRDPGEVTWPGIGPAAPSAAEPTPQMEEPTDA